MKAASSRIRTHKFLAFTAASLAVALTFNTLTAYADDSAYSQSYPKLDVETEPVPGYNLKCSGAGYRNVPTMLFSVYTSSNKEDNIKAYCIELEASIRLESDLKVDDWKEFPGTNKFEDNPDVQAEIAWTAQRSYPQTSLTEVIKASGTQSLIEKDAVTATQAAIWRFTNGFEYQGLSGTGQATANRVGVLRKYLTGGKNVGLKETIRSAVETKDENGTSKAGDPVGPIRFEFNQATVKLTNEPKYDLIDKDGKVVNRNAVPAGTDLFLRVPADVSADKQEFKIFATGSVYVGKPLTSRGSRSQAIIIGSNKEITAEASVVLKWNAILKATTPAPTPTLAPSNSTPAPKPFKSGPSTPKSDTPKKPGLPRAGII